MNLKRKLARVFRFGLMKRLKRGGRVTIFPSFKCSHDCSYCTLRKDGVFPVNKLLPIEDWMAFLLNYDYTQRDSGGIRDVILTGGEPTILPYFKELLEWMLFEKKWYVTMFSNLSNRNLLKIKPSLRLRVGATFHHGQISQKKWEGNYNAVNKVHRVDVEEIEDGWLSYSTVKPLVNEKDVRDLVEYIRVAPDLSIHMICYHASRNFCKDE
jgi:MoaA/NifB/PqqE/SkfB family radical SAM enzyme